MTVALKSVLTTVLINFSLKAKLGLAATIPRFSSLSHVFCSLCLSQISLSSLTGLIMVILEISQRMIVCKALRASRQRLQITGVFMCTNLSHLFNMTLRGKYNPEHSANKLNINLHKEACTIIIFIHRRNWQVL